MTSTLTVNKKLILIIGLLVVLPILSFGLNKAPDKDLINCNSEQIKTDISAQLNTLSYDLEEIRNAIGKKPARKNMLQAKNASSREIYFEAENLYKKLDRLSYEITGIYRNTPELDERKITICDVDELLNQSFSLIEPIKNRLNIVKESKQASRKNTVTKAEIFNQVLEINSQINNLSYQKTMPSDVFNQVTIAIRYLENVLVFLNISNDLAIKNISATDKTPENVYNEMLQTLQDIQSVYTDSGLTILDFQVQDDMSNIMPDDVLNLAKITVAEVRYLATFLPNPIKPKSYDFGYKTPSEVYQQVILLKLQLDALKKYAVQHPDWVHRDQK
ncbi:hypothetical protein OAO18_05695 [Francisellaceae bacterium]|nr:hypothetical protein [Francisellaceae bacterium]